MYMLNVKIGSGMPSIKALSFDICCATWREGESTEKWGKAGGNGVMEMKKGMGREMVKKNRGSLVWRGKNEG